MLSYIALSSIMLAFAIYVRYDFYLQWFVTRNLLTEYDTLSSTGWWQKLTIEIFIVLVAPYPFFLGIKYTEINTNWNVTI
jgi:hypothetical protein